MTVTWPALALLAVAGFAAGWVDSIAGGGGLISLPSILLAGVPPHVALGTNKLQSICGTSAAAWRYARGGHVDGRLVRWLVPLALAGSVLGSSIVLRLAPEAVRALLVPVFLAIALFLATRRDFGARARPERRTRARRAAAAALALAIGFYDGFFGPGTGVFFFLAMVLVLGYDALSANGNVKVLNWSTNAAALAVFLPRGQIDLKLALVMAAANALGGWTGSRLAIRRGQRFIRWMVLAVVVALSLKLAFG